MAIWRGTATNAATAATTVLSRAGIAHTIHRYQHDPAAVSYGLEAANALGVSAERVFKTLLADVDGNLVVAVVPVGGSLDLKALASASGGKRASMAASAAAERATGYVVGGISPLGQRRQLPTFVDRSAIEYDTVYVSAGRRGMDVELAPADLIRLTGATTARIGRQG
ncbi:MAG TPA: Cys-tRNA(Pro) deacylase [Jiangellaceae bacterium]|jgi:Cys-tRNA(Pro)/Cys-tRNA(Cys) deacylase|nr:Cys-tRNA(Pro) deacylase [Jiangellaceae bacterium]